MPKTSETSSFLPPINPRIRRAATSSSFCQAPGQKLRGLDLELTTKDLEKNYKEIKSSSLDSIGLERNPTIIRLPLPSLLRALALPSSVDVRSAATATIMPNATTCDSASSSPVYSSVDSPATFSRSGKVDSTPLGSMREPAAFADLETATVLDSTVFSPKL